MVGRGLRRDAGSRPSVLRTADAQSLHRRMDYFLETSVSNNVQISTALSIARLSSSAATERELRPEGDLCQGQSCSRWSGQITGGMGIQGPAECAALVDWIELAGSTESRPTDFRPLTSWLGSLSNQEPSGH